MAAWRHWHPLEQGIVVATLAAMAALFMIPVLFAWLAGLGFLRLGRWTWRPFTRLLQLAAQTAALLLVGAGVIMIGTDAGRLGALPLFFAAHIGWQLWRDRRRESRLRPPGVIDVAPSTPTSDWDHFLGILDRGQRQRAHEARAAIDGFLDEAGRTELDQDDRALALALSKRIPQLMEAWRERATHGSARDRRAYGERTLAIIEQMALEAIHVRTALHRDGERGFDTLERYFAGIAGRRSLRS